MFIINGSLLEEQQYKEVSDTARWFQHRAVIKAEALHRAPH